MRTRILIAVMFLGLGLISVLLWRFDRQVQRERRENPQMTAAPAAGPSAPATAPDIAGGTPPGVAAVPTLPPTAEEADFQRWVTAEAQQINQRGLDQEAKRKEMAKIAAQLTPTKARQLLQIAQSATASAGEKIISAYLLVEAGPVARAQLQALIVAPLSVTGPQEPHSEGEMRSMQERSVRVMALDGLATKAETDVSAREALAQTIPNIPDPYIKSIAEKRLSKIKPR